MLIGIFNSKNVLLQFLLIAIVYISVFYFPVNILPNNGFNPLYGVLINLIGNNQILSRIVFVILVISPILLAQYFATLFGIIQRSHFHFLFFAPLLIFSNSMAWSITPVVIALLLLVVGVANLFQLNRAENPIALSSTALIFSISSLFYSLFIWNIFLIIIALIIFREFNLRELLMVIASYTLPYVYVFSWYFIDDKLELMWNSFIDSLFSFSIDISSDGTYLQYAFIVFLLFFSIYIITSIILSLRNKLITIRAYLAFLIITFIFSLLLLLFSGDNSPYHYIIVQFLIAILYSIHLNEGKKNWIHESIVMLFVFNYIFNYYLMLNA